MKNLKKFDQLNESSTGFFQDAYDVDNHSWTKPENKQKTKPMKKILTFQQHINESQINDPETNPDFVQADKKLFGKYNARPGYSPFYAMPKSELITILKKKLADGFVGITSGEYGPSGEYGKFSDIYFTKNAEFVSAPEQPVEVTIAQGLIGNGITSTDLRNHRSIANWIKYLELSPSEKIELNPSMGRVTGYPSKDTVNDEEDYKYMVTQSIGMYKRGMTLDSEDVSDFIDVAADVLLGVYSKAEMRKHKLRLLDNKDSDILPSKTLVDMSRDELIKVLSDNYEDYLSDLDVGDTVIQSTFI